MGGLTTLIMGSLSGYLLLAPEIKRRRGEIRDEKVRGPLPADSHFPLPLTLSARWRAGAEGPAVHVHPDPS